MAKAKWWLAALGVAGMVAAEAAPVRETLDTASEWVHDVSMNARRGRRTAR